MSSKALIALAVLSTALGACEAREGPAASAKLCHDFKTVAAPLAAGAPADAAAPVEDCVRRWAYSLASSRDDADTVAAAAVAACRGPLARWNQQSLAPGAGDQGEAISITTGQPTSAITEHYAFAEARSLLFVVQARAGRCSPPPIENGAPTGVAG